MLAYYFGLPWVQKGIIAAKLSEFNPVIIIF